MTQSLIFFRFRQDLFINSSRSMTESQDPQDSAHSPKRNDAGPQNFFIDMCNLIVESRIPGINERGYGDGLHCPPALGTSTHACDLDNFECQKQQRLIHHLLDPVKSNCLEIEVIMLPECCADTTLKDRIQSKEYSLLEKWSIHCIHGSLQNTIYVPHLLRAVRSFLHFSQISAWLSSTKGKSPSNIYYWVKPNVNEVSTNFDKGSEVHTFPMCHISEQLYGCVKVQFSPRTAYVPVIPCSKHPPVVVQHQKTLNEIRVGSPLMNNSISPPHNFPQEPSTFIPTKRLKERDGKRALKNACNLDDLNLYDFNKRESNDVTSNSYVCNFADLSHNDCFEDDRISSRFLITEIRHDNAQEIPPPLNFGANTEKTSVLKHPSDGIQLPPPLNSSATHVTTNSVNILPPPRVAVWSALALRDYCTDRKVEAVRRKANWELPNVIPLKIHCDNSYLSQNDQKEIKLHETSQFKTKKSAQKYPEARHYTGNDSMTSIMVSVENCDHSLSNSLSSSIDSGIQVQIPLKDVIAEKLISSNISKKVVQGTRHHSSENLSAIRRFPQFSKRRMTAQNLPFHRVSRFVRSRSNSIHQDNSFVQKTRQLFQNIKYAKFTKQSKSSKKKLFTKFLSNNIQESDSFNSQDDAEDTRVENSETFKGNEANIKFNQTSSLKLKQTRKRRIDKSFKYHNVFKEISKAKRKPNSNPSRSTKSETLFRTESEYVSKCSIGAQLLDKSAVLESENSDDLPWEKSSDKWCDSSNNRQMEVCQQYLEGKKFNTGDTMENPPMSIAKSATQIKSVVYSNQREKETCGDSADWHSHNFQILDVRTSSDKPRDQHTVTVLNSLQPSLNRCIPFGVRNENLDLFPALISKFPKSKKLLVNFEESILKGCLPTFSTIKGFHAEIGASGSFCPSHITLPAAVSFYQLGNPVQGAAPYVAHIVLGDAEYYLPKKGAVQVTLFNPSDTVVKMFVLNYDLSHMPPMCHTFIRQKIYSLPVGSTEELPASLKWLRFIFHLRFASSKTGKIFLHEDIKIVVLNKSHEDAASELGQEPRELRSFLSVPVNPTFFNI